MQALPFISSLRAVPAGMRRYLLGGAVAVGHVGFSLIDDFASSKQGRKQQPQRLRTAHATRVGCQEFHGDVSSQENCFSKVSALSFQMRCDTRAYFARHSQEEGLERMKKTLNIF